MKKQLIFLFWKRKKVIIHPQIFALAVEFQYLTALWKTWINFTLIVTVADLALKTQKENTIFSVQNDCSASLMSSCIFVVEKCVCLVILSALPKIVNKGFLGFCPLVVKIFKNVFRHSMLQNKILICTETCNKQICCKTYGIIKKELVIKFLKDTLELKIQICVSCPEGQVSFICWNP